MIALAVSRVPTPNLTFYFVDVIQAQQALLEQQWHPSLRYHDALEAGTNTPWPPTTGTAGAAAAVTSARRLLGESHSSSSGTSSSSGSSSKAGPSSSAAANDGQHAAWWLPYGAAAASPQQQQQQLLFRGLRVRMGITTGLVAKGNNIKNSPVYKAAQGA
jgi:hypothetical protein